MHETLRCPNCEAELMLPASPDAPSVQCPRCRYVVDRSRSRSSTALTADGPGVPTAYAGEAVDLDDHLPRDLRALIRPDPLRGELLAVVAVAIVAIGVLSCALQAYVSLERGTLLASPLLRLPAEGPLNEWRHAWRSHERSAFIAGCIQAVALSLATVFFLGWLYQAAANLKLLQSVGASHTPAMAVVWYLIPFANLYRPYFIMQEIWRGSDPNAIGNSLAWLDVRPARLVCAWWFTLLAAGALALLGWYHDRSDTLIAKGTLAWCASHFALGLAGIQLIFIIVRITDRQRQRYARLYEEHS